MDSLTEKRGKDYEIGKATYNPYSTRTVKELKTILHKYHPHLKDDESIDWKTHEELYKKHGYYPTKEGNPWFRKHISIKFIRGRYQIWKNRILLQTMIRLKVNRRIPIKFEKDLRLPHRDRYFQSKYKNSPFSKEL